MAHRTAEHPSRVSIELEGVSKWHGAARAMDDVTLKVATGELVALIGPSGSGKTTVLRVIAGLERNYAGIVRIGGRDVSEVAARERRIGFVFQNYALFRHMSVASNIAFGLRVRPRAARPAASAIRERVAELLDLVQMGDLAARFPDQLSGGQRQRVALARALATEPAVLLLDEPFGALDPPIRNELRRTLRDLHDRLGLTTVLVTHDRDEAFELSDRVAVLGAGRVQQVGTPQELDRRPASMFVFEFLGESIRIGGQVRGGVFRPDALPLSPVATTLPDGTALAVIRPGEVTLDPAGGEGRVVSVQKLVGTTRYGVVLAEHHLAVLASPKDPELRIGQSCGVGLAEARIIPG